MLVPYDWLKEYLQTDAEPERLAEALTMAGLEVEEIREIDGRPVLDTKITPNRGDWLSMIGVAREAAACLPAEYRRPEINCRETGPPCSPEFSVEIEDPEGCPRYSARLVRNVEIGDSPQWLQEKMRLAGMRPISNIVDATNFVMWELGQPLHAFDASLLRGQKIIVRRAWPDEILVMIDESERRLDPQDLVIADAERAVALAGVMGGADTEVRDRTIDVLLESAHFDPVSVRLTALRHGMSTEASYRFERFVDPEGTVAALDRVAEIMADIAGGEVAEGAIDVYPGQYEECELTLRPERANEVLGTEIPATDMAEYLRRLDMEVEENGILRVTVPTFRPDLEREIDLVEEVARVHGYERIPTTISGVVRQAGRPTRLQALERLVRRTLLQCGLNESMTMSLMDPADLDRLNLSADHPARSYLAIANPMIEDQSAVRSTLLAGALRAVAHNHRQRVHDVALFEVNRVFLPAESGPLPQEQLWAYAVATGSPLISTWNLPGERAQVDFYWLRGVLEELIAVLRIEGVTWRRSDHGAFHPGRSADAIVGGRVLATVGEVAPAVREAFDIGQPVYLLDIDLDLAFELAGELPQYAPLPRFPPAERDLALVLADDDDSSAAAVSAVIRDSGGESLRSAAPFDEFRDPERVGAGKKSLAFRLEFRAADRTLTDEEVDGAMEAIQAAVQEKLGAQVRDW